MKQYRVEITDRALKDMEEIYTYIADQLQAPENAIRQYDRIADAVLSLNEFPERIHVMESGPEQTVGLRQLLADNFSAFYLIQDDRVIVTRVLYSASDISKRLLDN